ncbi:exodeoxyribonuclease III [Peptococcaceae bacterium 1198_IL3148]
MKFKVASFNVNSIRARLGILTEWLDKNQPDVLCIQETKVSDEQFPLADIKAAGFNVVFNGQKSYNGVAIVSPHEITDVSKELGFPADSGEARFIKAVVKGIPVVNSYIPQGQDVNSPKFAYKLSYISHMRQYFAHHFRPDAPLLWLGDFNVALEDIDVHDPKRLRGRVMFHPEEHKVLNQVKEWGFVDVFRQHQPEGGNFTFWDYRIPNGVQRNVGWRLDHIWATKPLAQLSTQAWIDKEPRLKEKPSDHTFIVAEFEL